MRVRIAAASSERTIALIGPTASRSDREILRAEADQRHRLKRTARHLAADRAPARRLRAAWSARA